MHRAALLVLLTLLALASTLPLTAGELLVPLAAGTAPDGTTYSTRLWVTNTGAAARRVTYTFIAPGADGTRAPAGTSVNVVPGATVVVANLGPAGKSGLLWVTGAPQLLLTARQEALGPNGAFRAAVAAPVVSGHDLTAGLDTLYIHGMSNKPGGLITDLHLVNAAKLSTQCGIDAFRFDGSRIAPTVRLTLPALSVHVFEKVLDTLGATNIDETHLAISCDQAFYAYARVYKPGSGELNLMTPTRSLGQAVVAGAAGVR